MFVYGFCGFCSCSSSLGSNVGAFGQSYFRVKPLLAPLAAMVHGRNQAGALTVISGRLSAPPPRQEHVYVASSPLVLLLLLLGRRGRRSRELFRQPHRESPFYRRQLWCRRPSTLRPWALVPNTCSLIGKVAVPPRRCGSRSGSAGAYTILEVENPSWVSNRRAFSPFQILLMMWNELAEVSLKYLQPNVFIYVSGHLSSYEKVDGNGKKEILQK